MRALISVLPLLATAVSPAPVQTCSAPVSVPASVTTPNATYYSTDEPPARYSHPPAVTLRVVFGQAAIDKLCGRPPCGMMFYGCQRGDTLALPDPFTSPDFPRITRHELAHVNGWPETHGV